MHFIDQTLPNVGDFLALEVEDVARLILEDLRRRDRYIDQHGETLLSYLSGQFGPSHVPRLYDGKNEFEVKRALAEGWGWLETHGFLAPFPDNDNLPRRMLTRRARGITSEEEFEAYRLAASVPWDMLHPLIRDHVRSDLLTGRYDAAVFQAFKEVEIAVRDAGKWPSDNKHVGVKLMRTAFAVGNEPGLLTDATDEAGEQQALSDLFAGAVGYAKNPQSHRRVGVSDVGEAVELVMLASHLLRIVEKRRAIYEEKVRREKETALMKSQVEVFANIFKPNRGKRR